MIHIWLVEDDHIIADSLIRIFSTSESCRISRHFIHAEAYLDCLAKERTPDIVLMDISLPGINGIEAVKHTKQIFREIEIIMLTVHVDDQMVFDALCAGASGYLLKSTSTKKIHEAIHEVKRGGAPMSTQIARMVINSFNSSVSSPLSEREQEVLSLLCEGKSYKMIADDLFISMDTVRTHIRHIYKKLEVNSSTEAVAKAFKNKWVSQKKI